MKQETINKMYEVLGGMGASVQQASITYSGPDRHQWEASFSTSKGMLIARTSMHGYAKDLPNALNQAACVMTKWYVDCTLDDTLNTYKTEFSLGGDCIVCNMKYIFGPRTVNAQLIIPLAHPKITAHIKLGGDTIYLDTVKAREKVGKLALSICSKKESN